MHRLIIARSQVRGLPAPPIVQPPQDEDATRLLSAAMAEDAELGLLLRLAVLLGARRGELCALRWPDIDFDWVAPAWAPGGRPSRQEPTAG
jgi:integrase